MTSNNGTGHRTPQEVSSDRKLLAGINIILALTAAAFIALGDGALGRAGMAVIAILVGEMVFIAVMLITKLEKVENDLYLIQLPTAEEIAQAILKQFGRGTLAISVRGSEPPADTAGHDDAPATEPGVDEYVQLGLLLRENEQEIARYEQMLAEALADFAAANDRYQQSLRDITFFGGQTSPSLEAVRKEHVQSAEVLDSVGARIEHLLKSLDNLREARKELQNELIELGRQTKPSNTADHDDTPATPPANSAGDDDAPATEPADDDTTGEPTAGVRYYNPAQPHGNLTPEHLPGYLNWDTGQEPAAEAPTVPTGVEYGDDDLGPGLAHIYRSMHERAVDDEAPTAPTSTEDPEEHELLDSGTLTAVGDDRNAKTTYTADLYLVLIDELSVVQTTIGDLMDDLCKKQAKLKAAQAEFDTVALQVAEEAKHGGPSGPTAAEHLKASLEVSQKQALCAIIEDHLAEKREEEADLIARLAELGVTASPIRFELVVSDEEPATRPVAEEASDNASATEPATDHYDTTAGANVIPFAPFVPDRPHAAEIGDPMEGPLALLRTRLEPIGTTDGTEPAPTASPVTLEMGTAGDLMIPQPFGSPTSVGDPEPPPVEAEEEPEPAPQPATPTDEVERWSGAQPDEADVTKAPDGGLADSAASSAQWEEVYKEASGNHSAVPESAVVGSPAVDTPHQPTPAELDEMFDGVVPPPAPLRIEPARTDDQITASAGWIAAPHGDDPATGE